MDNELRLAERTDPIRFENLKERIGQRVLPEVEGVYLVTGRTRERSCKDENCPVRIVEITNYIKYMPKCRESTLLSYLCLKEWNNWTSIQRIR